MPGRATASAPAVAYHDRAVSPPGRVSRQRRWRRFEILTRSAESIFEPTHERSTHRLSRMCLFARPGDPTSSNVITIPLAIRPAMYFDVTGFGIGPAS